MITIPTDILICIATAVSTAIMGFLSIVIHLLLRISNAVGKLQARAEVDAERYTNVGLRLQGVENRLDQRSTV